MICQHHWHDQGVYETCCECAAHNCEAIQRVREIHKPDEKQPQFCDVCLAEYPCPTIKTLDGEQK